MLIEVDLRSYRMGSESPCFGLAWLHGHPTGPHFTLTSTEQPLCLHYLVRVVLGLLWPFLSCAPVLPFTSVQAVLAVVPVALLRRSFRRTGVFTLSCLTSVTPSSGSSGWGVRKGELYGVRTQCGSVSSTRSTYSIVFL